MEGFLSQNQNSWIAAHNNAFSHFGGVTKILVPDNLKTGVDQSSWYTPVINKTYHEMAEHYGTAVVPARVRERFVSWAQQVGPYTTVAVQAILAGYRVEQQGYKACMGVLKLADRYSLVRLEAACERALSYTPNPSYKPISTILKSGQDTINAGLSWRE